MTSPARAIALIFVVAVVLNYPWELAQAPLYEWKDKASGNLWHCFVASLGDGVLVLLMFSAGRLVLGRRNWFSEPGPAGYLLMLLVGLSIAVVVEWTAVHIANRWAYTERMPLIPGLEIGLVPIAQMLVLPPLIFWLVTRFRKGSVKSER